MKGTDYSAFKWVVGAIYFVLIIMMIIAFAL